MLGRKGDDEYLGESGKCEDFPEFKSDALRDAFILVNDPAFPSACWVRRRCLRCAELSRLRAPIVEVSSRRDCRALSLGNMINQGNPSALLTHVVRKQFAYTG